MGWPLPDKALYQLSLAGVFGTVGARNDDSGTTLKSTRQIELGYETFGLYPIVSLAFKIRAVNSSNRTSASDEG
jgi:hypothetical protein